MSLFARNLDVVIVGGGQAGICLSYFLQKGQARHIVLEKDRAFSAWYGRWDAFRMNTANWMNTLPGAPRRFVPGARSSAIATRTDALRYFQTYLQVVNPPLYERTEVTLVQQVKNGSWRVITPQTAYEAPNVAICTGHASHPRLPAVAVNLPPAVPQLHASDYRNPAQITQPNVLVVGSGSSGVQICEDLAKSNRFSTLYLATSGNMVIPWKLLGIPIGTFPRLLKVFDINLHSWLGKRIVPNRGKGDPAMAPSPAKLADTYGVELAGKVTAVNGNAIVCSDRRTIPLRNLAVVWCTGFYANYDFIQVGNRKRVFDNSNAPIQKRGVAPGAPGLTFVGLKFQHTLSSHLLHGVGRDARYVARHIIHRLNRAHTPPVNGKAFSSI